VRLRIEVQAANWIPVEEVRVIANGFTTLTFDATTSPKVSAPPASPYSQALGKITRFDAEIPVNLAADTYFIVEAGTKLAPLPTPDALIDKIVPGMIPLGFTNPIFVDLAGDGFDAPGLPVMATATQLQSELPAFARLERADRTWLAMLRGWFSGTLATLTTPREASAHGSDNVLADGTVVTGKELAEKVQRDKNTPTEDYFPLHKFSIPADAADAALKQQLPPAEAQQLESDRAKAAGAAR
jgi:hypothetical protein